MHAIFYVVCTYVRTYYIHICNICLTLNRYVFTPVQYIIEHDLHLIGIMFIKVTNGLLIEPNNSKI